MHRLLASLAAIALVWAALALVPPAAAAEAPYDIHVIIPLTGGGAFLGKAEQDSIAVAEQVINREGGIHGRPLHAIFHDDQSSPQTAVQLLTEVIGLKPAVILGSTVSALCNAMAPLVKDGPVMYCFSPSVRTEPGGWEFTAQIDSHDQQRALLTYFRAKGWKRIALITTSDSSGQDAERSILDLLTEPGFKDMALVANQHFANGDVTVAAQIATMRAGNPQAIVSWATTAAGGTVFRGLKQAGIDLPTAASGSNMTVSQMAQYAAFLPRQLFFGVSEWAANGDARVDFPPAVAAQQKLFVSSTRSALHVYPDSGIELGWEPIRVVADALNHLAPGADAQQLHDFLLSWTGHIGADGIYDFRKTPQRGLDIDNAVVVAWDPARQEWHLVSKPTGLPIE